MRRATTEKEHIILTEFIRIDVTRCGTCMKCHCIDKCIKKIIGRAGSFWRKQLTIQNPESCIGCKKCIKACPHKVFSEVSKSNK